MVGSDAGHSCSAAVVGSNAGHNCSAPMVGTVELGRAVVGTVAVGGLRFVTVVGWWSGGGVVVRERYSEIREREREN